MLHNAQVSQTIACALQKGNQVLAHSSASPRLDAEILLGHSLQATRSYLHAWPEKVLSETQEDSFEQLLVRRSQGEPIAYLVGYKEFWSLKLKVTPAVLIPRDETELLVERVLELFAAETPRVIADLGTGSGAIALAIAKERPLWQIFATDLSKDALDVAQENAKRLGLANVFFSQGFWCNALPRQGFDAIISNPPYIAEGDRELEQQVADFEPLMALIAQKEGLQDIQQILREARGSLKSGGYLLLEHGYQQAKAVQDQLSQAGYEQIGLYQDLAGLDRVTVSRFAGHGIAS
ncbi:MAG: peptide chain release factor N(5)-glutamine methyltransferase [Gammaproteobacteria bacterium]|nr:peptide chain release factor N(5)-glutamine methyltransferase [Gammaproteobacteria bacterium]